MKALAAELAPLAGTVMSVAPAVSAARSLQGGA
jgi:hypothetical protein